MNMTSHIIRGEEVAIEVCKALGLDPGKVRRIVLDLSAGPEPLIAYVEICGDERFLDIKWELSEGVKVEFADKGRSAVDDFNLMKAIAK